MDDLQWSLYIMAKTQDGVEEFEPGSNPKIVEYHSCTSLKAQDDAIPWCSSFVNWCCSRANIPGTNSAAARSWLNWGEEIKEPQMGDIVIIQRDESKTSGHVGFYEGTHGSFEKQLIKIFGGNQGNRVCSKWFQKADVLGYRRAKSRMMS